MQTIQQKSKVLLGVFLATHDGRVCAVLLQGPVNIIWHEGLANTIFIARSLPVLESSLLDHHKLVNQVNPAKERSREGKNWSSW